MNGNKEKKTKPKSKPLTSLDPTPATFQFIDRKKLCPDPWYKSVEFWMQTGSIFFAAASLVLGFWLLFKWTM